MWLPVLLSLFGIALCGASLVADFLGVGYPGFGPAQVTGTALGGGAVVVAFAWKAFLSKLGRVIAGNIHSVTKVAASHLLDRARNFYLASAALWGAIHARVPWRNTLIVFFIFVSVLYVAVEIRYRSQIQSEFYASINANSFTGYSENPVLLENAAGAPGVIGKQPKYGYHTPNQDVFYWSYYNGQNNFRQKFHINNLGLVSWRDYDIKKSSDEYRIVVFGQEQTATATASISWPDHLQDYLNANLQVRQRLNKRISVFNFGMIDGSFGHFADAWVKKARFFDPDLIIINMVETDFIRMKNKPANVLKNGLPIELFPYTFYLNDEPKDWVTAILHCTSRPITLLKSNCTVSVPYGLSLSETVGNNPRKARQAINRLKKEFLTGSKLWLTIKPLFLMDLVGRGYDPLVERGIFEAQTSADYHEKGMVEYARVQLRRILDEHPNVLILHSINYAEAYGGDTNTLVDPPLEFPLTRELMALDPMINVLDMRKYIPFHKGAKTSKTWYQYPGGLEKWSDEGTKMYAQAAADAIKDKVFNIVP